MTRQEMCDAAVPWYCSRWGFPALTDILSGGRPCAEAWDLYDACIAGAYNPNLAPGSGAGKAPDIAADPNVNYNDPAVQDAIRRGQNANDAAAWAAIIEANRRLLSGDGSDPDNPPAQINWIVLGALGLVVVGAVVLKGR